MVMKTIIRAAQIVSTLKLAKQTYDNAKELVPAPIRDQAIETATDLTRKAAATAVAVIATHAPERLSNAFKDRAAERRRQEQMAALETIRQQRAALEEQEAALTKQLSGEKSPARKKTAAKRTAAKR